MAGDTLRQHLRRIRRRLVLCEGVSGGSWGIIASVGLLLLAMWLDLLWELSPFLRIASVVGAVGVAPIVWMACGWLTASRGRGPVLARRMDRVAGTGGMILSGWDLAQGPPWPSSLSMGLAELAVARAAETAGNVPAGQVISWRNSRRSMGSLLLLCAAVAALALMMPQLAKTQWRRFTAPFADQPPFSRITFHVEPGDTEVVYGNGLDIYATAEGPPTDRVEMVIVGRTAEDTGARETGREEAIAEETTNKDANVVPMFPEADGRWRAVLASVTQESDYFVRSRDGRSKRYHIGVITVPRITAVRFRVVPPEYTRQGPYEGPLPRAGIEGLRGTKVTVWATSNRPLSTGLAMLTAEAASEELPMSPTSSSSTATGEVAATFEIRRSGKLELRVVDEAGQPSRESFVAGITLLEDQHPIIRILEPRPISLATPDVTLGVVLAAEDDYGLSRVQLFRSLNDSRHLPMDVPLPPNLRRWSDVVPLPLARYGLTPGDVIKLFARAEDNDPAGAKGSESSVVTVQIISQEQYERMLQVRQGMEVLMSKYRQAQRRLESLREKQKGLEKKAREQPAGKPLADELRSELAQLAAQMAQDAAALRKAAQSPLPYDIDKNFTKHLEKLAKSLEENQRRLQRLTDLSSQSKLSPKELAEAFAQMLEQDGASQLEYEQSALLPLEMLERAMPLIANQSKFVQLYRRQRELAERLASLKGREGQDDPELKARMRDLEAEQRRIREALDQLLTDIDDRAERLPDDPKLEALRKSAKEFVKAVRESGALESMAQAEAGLAEFSGTRGHLKAKEAADILEKFLKKCEGMGQAAGQCLVFAPGLGQGLGNTIAQLLAEMGLNPGANPGDGTGQGSGGGYSAQASTADNTGLYGNHPALDGSERQSGSGQSQQAGTGGNFTHRGQERPSTMVESAGPVGSGSASEGSVPANYRRRVADYFRRIGEETGGH